MCRMLAFVTLLLTSISAWAQSPFVEVASTMPHMWQSMVATADIDKDGDLDVLLSGSTTADGKTLAIKLFRNDGNMTFTERPTTLPAVSLPGWAQFGDYDKDGDPDLLLIGRTASASVGKIFRNDGNFTFTDLGVTLMSPDASAWAASAFWTDIDNDKDLDVLLAGVGTGDQVVVYTNTNGAFAKAITSFESALMASPGDYDNDGLMDVYVCGRSSGTLSGKLYHNAGGLNFSPVTTTIEGYAGSSWASWGDYDKDGDLDLIVSGWTGSGNSRKAHIYRLQSGTTFTKIDAAPVTPTDRYSYVQWADYDKDGWLDIYICGFNLDGVGPVSRFFRNVNGAISAGPQLRPNNHGYVAISDLDGDGDVDVLSTGTSDDMINKTSTTNFKTMLYRNGGNSGGGGGTSKCTWAGTWNTNWGAMNLQQVADSVWGTYTYDAGKINGKVVGDKLIGQWSEYPSYAPSHDAGDITFTMAANCKTFAGNWRYGIGGTGWSGDWTGERAGFCVTGRILLNGKGLAGVEVSVGGKMGVTDANGYFAVNGVENGTVSVTPKRQGTTFVPPTASITVADANIVDVAFTATTSGGGQTGDGCNKTISSNTPTWSGDYYPSLMIPTNGVATARETNGTLHAKFWLAPGYVYSTKSQNDGVTWTAPVRTESEPNSSGANVLLVDAAGVLHAADQFNVGCYYKRSTDGGATWSAPFYLHDQGWGDWDYSAHIAFDTQNKLHAVYYAAHGWSDPPYNVKHRYSSDAGVTWQPETDITGIPNEDARGSGATSPVLAAGPSNKLHVLYTLQTSVSPDRYKYVLRTWSGSAWDAGVDILTGIVTPSGYDIAVDPSGTVHAVYESSMNASDSGKTTMKYVTITNGVLGAARTIGDPLQYFYTPSIGFANGKVMIAYTLSNPVTKKGGGVYVYNITDNWACPTMVSKTATALQVNIPWTFYDRKPAGKNDITWVEMSDGKAEYVLCDLSTFTPKPCTTPVVEGPASVTSDSITVTLSSIDINAVGNPAEFPVVDFNVTVGQPREGMLGDLTYENFTVFEDGVKQLFTMNSKSAAKVDENEPAAVAIVIDGSTGIPDTTKQKLVELVQGLADKMKPNWRITIIKFADRVQQMADFTNNANTLIAAAIQPGPTGEEAVIMSAITEAVDRVALQSEKYKMVLAITSGRMTDPQFSAFATQNASSKGIPVFILGVTDIKGDPALRALAERSGGRMYTQGDDIDDVNEESAGTLGNAYRMRYTTTNQKRDGTTRNVKVVMTAPLKSKPSTIITANDAKTYKSPVNTSEAVVFIDAEQTTLPPGTASSTVAVSVRNITDVKGLMGAEINIEFDASQVELVGHREGEFLSPPPRDILSDLSNFSQALSGKITLNVVRVGGNPTGIQGSGPMYYLTFRAKSGTSRSAIRITQIHLRNALNADIPARIRDGELIAATAVNGPGAGVGSLFTNYNDSDPRKGTAQPAVFQITQPYTLTRIQTLHSDGATPTTISARDAATGQVYGPWNAHGEQRGNTQNALWIVDIEQTLQPGTYYVVDGQPTTWSFNSESDLRGICWVDGRKVNSDKPADHKGALLGDFDGNNVVNFPDYTVFVSNWNTSDRKGDMVSAITGEAPGVPPFMIETYPYRPDGLVNFEDQIVFAQMYNWTRGFGKLDGLRTMAVTPLTLRMQDVMLMSGERELRIDGVSAEHVLGLGMVFAGDASLMRGTRVSIGSLFDGPAISPSSFVDVRSGYMRADLVGLTSAQVGVNGSGGILRLRYRPTQADVRLTLEDVDARDVLNRRINIIYAEDADQNEAVQIVPTPANASVTLTIHAPHYGVATASVYDLTGRLVMTWQCDLDADGNGRSSYSVSGLPVGSYVVQVDASGHRSTLPLLIVR
ncbi:MAG: FG-GAP-like repeat-containing protein [Candidatus Kapabacteria bacterium]|nr:FG-GAP-like repeat-containing protein [Candidatus Kapabacteria bacterium]